MKKNYMLISLAAAALLAASLTGCGERAEQTEKQTEAVTTAERITEIQIERQPVTEKPTEPPTEPPTEKVTEKPTEPPTEADKDLTPEEELAQESELASEATYYANDDLNIRETPDTENSENIISSYDKGESVTVIAKTPHWYKVRKTDPYSGDTFPGYVHKDGLSETAVAADPQEDQDTASAPQDTGAQQAAPAPAEGVSGYEQSFPIHIASAANVRSSASDTADVIGTVDAGTNLTAVGESGDWYQVDYNGSVGFVHKNLVG